MTYKNQDWNLDGGDDEDDVTRCVYCGGSLAFNGVCPECPPPVDRRTFEAVEQFKRAAEAPKVATPEPAPTNDPAQPAIADLVIADLVRNYFPQENSVEELINDIRARKEFGIAKYGQPLKPFDSRDTLNDLTQEVVDAIKYSYKLLYEQILSKAMDNKPYSAEKRGALNRIVDQLIEIALALKDYENTLYDEK